MGNRKQACSESLGRNQVKGSRPQVSRDRMVAAQPRPPSAARSHPPLGTQPGCHLPTTLWPLFTFLALSQRSRNSDGARFPGPCA